MKTVEMARATGSLSEYAKKARKETVVVTRRGKPFAAVVPLDLDRWEDFVVSTHPGFIKMIKRSEARYRAEGGIPLEKVEREFRKKLKGARKGERKAG